MNVDIKTTRDYYLSQLLTRTVDRQWLKFSRSYMKASRHATDEQERADRTRGNPHSTCSETSDSRLCALCCTLGTGLFCRQLPIPAALAAMLSGTAHTLLLTPKD